MSNYIHIIQTLVKEAPVYHLYSLTFIDAYDKQWHILCINVTLWEMGLWLSKGRGNEWRRYIYRKVSNISHTKYQNLNVYRFIF